MTIHLIPLDQIDPNPYQTREREDPAHVERIALSIVDNGLLQEPLARPVDGNRYQLAYGHTRLAAYRWIEADGRLGFDLLPLKLADLPDLQMFELAVRENSERKDLTPIEEARAMAVYRDQFGKRSEEIGALFGLQASTVRNKLRLLDLPATVQERVSDGELSEGTARSLLTMQKVAPESVDQMAETLASGGYENQAAVTVEIKRSLRDRPNTLEMWGSYKSGEPTAGTGLWPLDWIQPEQPCPTFAQFEKIYTGEMEGSELKEQFERTTYEIKSALGGTLDTLIEKGYDAGVASLAWHLIIPPACTKCPFYLRLDGSHWCGLKQCHARKKKAWLQAETERLSVELGIAIYRRDFDGQHFDVCDYWGDNPTWEGWFVERAEHLRLKPKLKDWNKHNLTESHTTQLVSVRAEYQKEAVERSQESAAKNLNRDAQKKQWEIEFQNRKRVDAFLWEVASQVFAVAFCDLPDAVLPDLASALGDAKSEKPEDRTERRVFYLRRIARDVLYDGLSWNDRDLGAAHVAGHLVGVATTWGVRLPDDWDVLAEGFELESVSVETEIDA